MQPRQSSLCQARRTNRCPAVCALPKPPPSGSSGAQRKVCVHPMLAQRPPQPAAARPAATCTPSPQLLLPEPALPGCPAACCACWVAPAALACALRLVSSMKRSRSLSPGISPELSSSWDGCRDWCRRGREGWCGLGAGAGGRIGAGGCGRKREGLVQAGHPAVSEMDIDWCRRQPSCALRGKCEGPSLPAVHIWPAAFHCCPHSPVSAWAVACLCQQAGAAVGHRGWCLGWCPACWLGRAAPAVASRPAAGVAQALHEVPVLADGLGSSSGGGPSQLEGHSENSTLTLFMLCAMAEGQIIGG